MAGLYFKIQADYDALIRAREEMVRVRKEIENLDTTSSPRLIHSLEKDLAKSTQEFDKLAIAAMKTGAELENNFKQKIYQSSTAVNILTEKIINQRAVVHGVEADVKRLSQSYANLGKFNTNSDQVLSELISAKKALDEEKAALFGLQQEQSKARLSVKLLKDEYASFKQTSKDVVISNNEIFNTIQSIPGPVGQAASSIKGLTKASLAFIATPLGAALAAISAALMAVTSWFRRTEEGQNALNVASAYFNQTLNSILDVVDDVGEWLWKAFTKPKDALKDLVDFLEDQVMNRMKAFGKMGEAIWKIFSGDFKGGFADLGNAITEGIYGIEDAGKKYINFLQEVNRKAKEAMSIAERQNALDIKKREFLVESAKLEAKINELREKAYNPNYSEKDRLIAVKEAVRLTDELYEKEIKLAEEKYKITQGTNNLSHSKKGAKEEEAQAEAELNKLKARRAAAQRALLEQIKMLNNAEKQRLKAQQELSRSILESELKLQSSRIAIMKDGKDKRVLLADQEYKETLATIQKEREEYQKKINETKGKEDPAVLQTFTDREGVAKDKRNNNVAEITKEYDKEYRQRTKALTNVFLNEEQRKLSAIKTRYDQERKWANEQLKTGGMTDEEHTSYTVNIDKAQQQETYRSLLDNLNDYKQQEKNLREKWDTDIAAAVETKDAALITRLMEGKRKALSSLNSQMLQESSEWMRLFGHLDTLTVEELNKLIDSIQKQLNEGSLVLNPVDAKALMDSLNQAKEKVAEKSPFQALAKSSEEMKKALADLEKAEKEGLSGAQLDVFKKKVKDAAENVKKSISAIRDAYGQVSDVMKSAGDLIGMVDEGVGETVNNAIALGDAVMNVGEVVANAVIAFAAGMNAMESASVILLVIKAVLMAVMAAISLFNGDKKHEKKIKKLQGQVDKLSRAYDRLGEAIEDAYSTDKADLIDKESENLRQQNELIRQQIREEEDKKKTDQDKIKDWQNTIEDNNRQIEENSKKGRVEAIMGSDIKSAIDEFAQAYADAWAKGEKAAGKSADIVKSLIRTSIIEMLKKDLKPEVEAFMTFLSGVMTDGIITAAEQQQIDEWQKKLEEIADKSLAGKDKWLEDDNFDQLGITSDSIGDTILDGLKAGKSGIKDFSSSFEDMMRTAILNSLKTKYLEGPLKEFQKKFSELSESGGQLTEAEIEELRNMYADIIEGAKTQFDSLKEISGLDFSIDSDNSLKGAFAKASEESIGLLAGQTGAVRVLLEEMKNSMVPIREQMQLIYALQTRGWEDVRAIRELTDKVNKNSERVADNTREIKAVADKISDNTTRTVDALEGTLNVKVKM